MVKHTQTIRPLLPTNCLSVFDHFVGLTLKELTWGYINFSNLCYFVMMTSVYQINLTCER